MLHVEPSERHRQIEQSSLDRWFSSSVPLRPGFAKGGRKISVGDDPSLKQGSPRVVLVEISDFQ